MLEHTTAVDAYRESLQHIHDLTRRDEEPEKLLDLVRLFAELGQRDLIELIQRTENEEAAHG